MENKLFIVGKNSYIGKNLGNIVRQFPYDVKFITSHPEGGDDLFLDFNYPGDFNYSIIKESDYIILLAAISSPDICRNNFKMAFKINVEGTIYFIKNVLKRRARVLFFSSDTVYGNSDNHVTEFSETSPVGEYAKMKKEVEDNFKENINFKVFRLSYVFSKNDKFTSYLNYCCNNNTIAIIYHPIFRKVIYLQDVIDSVILIGEKWDHFDNQIFNLCGNELLSRINLSEIYREIVDKRLKISVVEPDEAFFNARPKVVNMKSVFLKNLLGREPTPIETAFYQEFNKCERV